ncbi:polyphosphate--glucose phosphotransferase [Wenjunlia tyrosinilytica]|jgi:polyphosphate glucokinase|uniref:Polyphosphate glucokinase n=1 Tax=Wenjunlia tyrosinilytica TaxID=1544741 RepID=A0A918E074_9ACTN|nr:ROK family protein [Wenjunlia tyrosinilytica]GGO97660.1 polyphosphate glucokinase [Wenjunlia tyrosinilytica]
MNLFGVDIGGSGIKGAPVDLSVGALAQERHKVPTPHPSEPRAVAACVKEVVDHFGWSGPVGITFPAVVTGGVTRSAANVDQAWVDFEARKLFTDVLGAPATVVNDADAAGIAEVAFGSGRDRDGVVVLLTFGTGIGSALFIDGKLVPNTELGHLELRGKDAEKRASSHAKEVHELSWHEWAKRVEEYLRYVEKLFSPDLFVIGGGVSRKHDKFLPLIEGVRATIVPAALHNDAGIVGAAMAAAKEQEAAKAKGAQRDGGVGAEASA